jgi:hydrogenase expression/formation protein HypE
MSSAKRDYIRPLDFRHGRIDMNHGAGGRVSAQLIEELFVRAFDNDVLRQGNDGALLPVPPPGHRLVMATDAHVISPLFFPGGDIGCLAVHGTINDVAMLGATPLYLSASFILEEGFPLGDLQRIVESMAAASRAAAVPIVTGDTKVVERGKGDGVFISTTGLGLVPQERVIGGANARPGDAVLLSGSIGEHGVAVLSQRESLQFETAAHPGGRDAGRRPRGCGARAARPDARRPGHYAERNRAPVRGRYVVAGSRDTGAAAGGCRLRAARVGPAVHR